MGASLRDPAFLERFWHATRDLILLARDDGRFTDVNPRCVEVLGWTEQELESMHLSDLVHPEDRDAAERARARLASGERVHNHEVRFRCKDGSWRWMSWSVEFRDGELFAIARDITEMREAEELRAQARHAEAYAQHQRLLLNAASHELNTPLTPMVLEIARLREHHDPEVRSAATTLDRNTRRLQTTIAALLHAGRLSNRRIRPRLSDTDLAALLDRVAGHADSPLRPEAPSLTLRCDEALLEQAVAGLVDNAELHGGGAVDLRAEARDGHVRIEVHDDGPGLQGDRDAYFLPLTRGDDAQARSGAGLGLTTVRLVAEAHGGTAGLDARSAGRGTVAWIELPLAPRAAPAGPARQARPYQP